MKNSANLVLLGLCLLLTAGCAPSVRDSLAYRQGGPGKNPAEIALLVKTQVPLLTVLRVMRIDNDAYAAAEYGGYSDLQRTEFFELAPGRHTLAVSLDGSLRTTAGNPAYYVTKPIELSIEVEAGRQYVLWGDVWKDGSRLGITPLDDFCRTDFCRTQISSQARLDEARAWIASRLTEYWQARDQVATASFIH